MNQAAEARHPAFQPAAQTGAALPDSEAAKQPAQHATGARVGISRPHESAHLHVAGAAPYIDDLP